MSDAVLSQLIRAAAQGDRQAALSWYQNKVRQGEIQRPEIPPVLTFPIGDLQSVTLFLGAIVSPKEPEDFRISKIEISGLVSYTLEPGRIPYGLRFSWDGARLAPLSHWPGDLYSESTDPFGKGIATAIHRWIAENRALFDVFLTNSHRAARWARHREYQKSLTSLQKIQESLIDSILLSQKLVPHFNVFAHNPDNNGRQPGP